MSLTEKLLAGSVAVVLVIAALMGFLYVQQVKGTASADAFGKAKQDVIEAAEKRMEQRDREWRERFEELEREKREIKSAAQAVRVIERYVPQTTGHVAQVTREDLPQQIKEKLPNAPGYTVMTEQASVQMGKELVQCQQDKGALQVCSKDKEDLRAQLEAAQQQRDKWKETALGGSKAKRAGKALLLGGCAAGGAAIGAQRDSQGAAIGALVGAVGCALLSR